MGTGSRHSRPGLAQAVKEACGELGNTKEPSRNAVQAVCKEEGEAGEGPRTGNDLFFIHEETL